LELANWLVLRGAKKLVLSSRFGLKNGYQTQRVNSLKSRRVSVHISTSDVCSKSGCLSLIQEANELGPVDGIFNLAMVLKDGIFENQTVENFTACLAPKVQASKHLDEITRSSCLQLRYFIVFSSFSSGQGFPGQTNYGMANSVMERICEKRKLDGFPALAIQWSAIGEVLCKCFQVLILIGILGGVSDSAAKKLQGEGNPRDYSATSIDLSCGAGQPIEPRLHHCVEHCCCRQTKEK
jgi:fatty acid synthase